MQIEQLKPIIEAALLASSQPMTVSQLSDLFVEEDGVDREQIAMALEALGNDCDGRGIALKEVASGFRYQVRQEVHVWVSRMWTEKPSRYSRALLETLALIAYRQPITRPEIEQIRGVVVSSNIIKTLEEREWVRVVGHRDVPGKPALFGTTRTFLDYFNLRSLDELPPLSEIRDMEDPQLRFADEPFPPRVIRDLPIDPDAEGLDEQIAEENDEGTDVQAHDDDLNVQANDDNEHASTHDDKIVDHEFDAAAESTHIENPTSTADEAANSADADDSTAEQDEEYRA